MLKGSQARARNSDHGWPGGKMLLARPNSAAAMARSKPIVFTIVPRADGTFDVEVSDGGPPSFLISFRTRAKAEAWIAKLKGIRSN